ncbi:MAG: hypothetical protein IKL95_00275 [Alphaproteobacteria bacterium]|nr:hypothetical protein [Alphaproteobacteria bacterium]
MPIKKQLSKKSAKLASRRATNATVRVVRADNAPKRVSFGRAVSNFFKKYFQFNGVATRA